MIREPEVSAHEQAMLGVLGKLDRKIGDSYLACEGAPNESEALSMESGSEAAGDSVTQFIRVQAMRAMFRYCLVEGPDIAKVMKRFYGLGRAYYPELLWNMSDEDLAVMFGETRAAVSARRNRIVTKKLADAGFKGTRVRCQKSEGSIEKYADAQIGNRNRAKKSPATPPPVAEAAVTAA